MWQQNEDCRRVTEKEIRSLEIWSEEQRVKHWKIKQREKLSKYTHTYSLSLIGGERENELEKNIRI